MKNNNDQYCLDLEALRAFENATWILTHKESGEIIECDYREMSHRVKNGYISYWNKTYGKYPYNEEEINLEDIRVRCLDRGGCDISQVKKRLVYDASYTDILPQYSIDCYGWHYQCTNSDCKAMLSEISGKGEKIRDRIFCTRCFKYSEYR